MRDTRPAFRRPNSRSWILLAVFLLFALEPSRSFTQRGNRGSNAVGQVKIPDGTILPVALQTSLAFEKCKPGQILRGKIAQDVPLPDGSQIRKGWLVEGQVMDIAANPNAIGNRITVQFDRLLLAGRWVPIVTDLRALAGAMAVQGAAVPTEAPGEGSTYVWLPTRQIGGDSVYGLGGPVASSEDVSKVIGKSVAGGVLVQVSAKEGSPCRGDMGDNRLQALWVFSSDACGVYEIEHLSIIHAGRSDPKGKIVLACDTARFRLRAGDGLLLRVID